MDDKIDELERRLLGVSQLGWKDEMLGNYWHGDSEDKYSYNLKVFWKYFDSTKNENALTLVVVMGRSRYLNLDFRASESDYFKKI